MNSRLKKYLFLAILFVALIGGFYLFSENVSAVDAHLDQDGWEWHYDTGEPTKLLSVVNTGGSTEINIPAKLDGSNSLLYIGANCFYDAQGHTITKVLSMPNTVDALVFQSFRNCGHLTSVVLSSSLTSIGTQVFWECYGLTSITFPASLTSIGDTCFAYDNPLSMTFLGLTAPTVHANWLNALTAGSRGHAYAASNFPQYGSAFNGLTMGDTIEGYSWHVSGGNAIIDHYNGTASSITIPSLFNTYPTATIGYNAFGGNEVLTSVIIPNSVITVGPLAFAYCLNITSMSISNNCTTIQYNAFQALTHLASINIPGSVTSIGDLAFYQCHNLGTVNQLSANLTTIGDDIFRHCLALTALTVNAVNPNYVAISGIVYNTSMTEIKIYPCGKVGSYTIPSTILRIDDYNFFACIALTSVTIPNNIHVLGNYSFANCHYLINITIGSSVSYIGNHAFEWTERMNSIKFLGLIAPTISGANWLDDTNATIIRGHAYLASAFPAMGDYFNGLLMGTVLNSVPVFLTTYNDQAQYGYGYAYDAMTDEDAWVTYSMTTSSHDLSIDPAQGIISGKILDLANFWINITVNNGGGGIAWQNFTVQVSFGSSNPHVEITGVESGRFRVSFTYNLTDQPPECVLMVTWNFGDGQGSRDQKPVHTYGAPGDYLITVSLWLVNGDIAYHQQQISVGDPLEGATVPEVVSWWASIYGMACGAIIAGGLLLAVGYTAYQGKKRNRVKFVPLLLICVGVAMALYIVVYGGVF
jgi:hypothetical protein